NDWMLAELGAGAAIVFFPKCLRRALQSAASRILWISKMIPKSCQDMIIPLEMMRLDLVDGLGHAKRST
ncbi:hypothetical protein, partial [Escherichia coli]|uniref:hypothetical protein n=1 Tax=Escherichia coli TaxID=562 RepID=UPI00195409FF